MSSDRDTDQPVWYLAATPAAVSQWLVRLWRTSAVIEVLVVATAFLLPAESYPLRRLAPVLAAAALISLERASGRARTPQVSRLITAAHAMLQVLLLTGLLELSGGPSNAFSVIYAVLIALTAVTLGAGWASLVAGGSAVCYGLLISWHLEELVPAHHRLIDFPTHLFTVGLAIATMAELAAHFVGAASRAVARREAELDLMRRQAVDADQILAAFNGEASSSRGPAAGAVPSLTRVEWEHIQRVLADCGGNLSQAARLLGIHRRSLQRKLSKDPV
jgi:hypothetical protein